jgi:predicted DNA-binding transcriptional regulator AlpA
MSKARPIPPWPTKEQAARLATLLEVLAQAGVSAATWYRMVGTPEPVEIADRSVRYWTDEIDRYLASLPRRKAAAPAPAEQLQDLIGQNNGPPPEEPPPAKKKQPAKRKLTPGKDRTRSPPPAAPAAE